MKKLLFFTLIIFSISLVSCNNDISTLDTVNDKSEVKKAIQSETSDMLDFNTKQELLEQIESKNPSILESASPNFHSLVTKLPENERIDDYETYYEKLGYDTLVPNPNFARFLNIDGELKVGRNIYKVTPNGTYQIAIDKFSLFNKLFHENSNLIGTKVDDKTNKITDGIILINTFKEDQEAAKNQISNSFSSLPNYSIQLDQVNEPDINSFQIYSATRKTILGKLFQNILSTSITPSINFNKKRRVRGQFYNHWYGVYNEIGARGWTDKKNWIGWSKTAADELRVGWSNVLIQVNIPDTYKRNLAAITKSRYLGINYNAVLPGYENEKLPTAVFVIPDIKNDFLEKTASAGLPQLLNILKPYTSTNELNKAAAFLITTKSSIYTFVSNQKTIKYNCKSYTHVFLKNTHIDFSADFGNLPGFKTWSDGASWLGMFKGSIQRVATLKSGQIYICARFGSLWRGMRIVKYLN